MEWLRPSSSMNHAKRTFCVCHTICPNRLVGIRVWCPVRRPSWAMVRPFTTRDLSTRRFQRRRPCVCVPMTSSRPIATDRVRAIDRYRAIDRSGRSRDRSIDIDRASLADAAHSRAVRANATGRTRESTRARTRQAVTSRGRVASGCRRHKPSVDTNRPSEFIHSFIHSFTD